MLIEVKRYTPHEKGPFKGYFDIEMPHWGVSIKNLRHFKKTTGQEWVLMPSLKNPMSNSVEYYQTITFTNTKDHLTFQRLALTKLKSYINEKQVLQRDTSTSKQPEYERALV